MDVIIQMHIDFIFCISIAYIGKNARSIKAHAILDSSIILKELDACFGSSIIMIKFHGIENQGKTTFVTK